MIFVDTGAFYAANVPQDPDHDAARAFLSGNREPLLTTDYVIAELLTLFRARSQKRRSIVVGRHLLEQEACTIEWISKDDVMEAWRIYQRYHDKAWSFVDCVSYAVIERMGISKAFAFDDHFRQFGHVTVLP
jgi:predicted nucleic acid-binding protein